MSEDGRNALMSDEHSLDEQRVFNIAYWVFGFDPQAGREAAQMYGPSQERAQRCGSEYSKLENGMRKNFGKFLKVRPMSGRG